MNKAQRRRKRYYDLATKQHDVARARAHELLCDLLCVAIGADDWTDDVEREIEEVVDELIKAAAAKVQQRACAPTHDPHDPAVSGLLEGASAYGVVSSLTLLLVRKGVIGQDEIQPMLAEASKVGTRNIERAHGVVGDVGPVAGPFDPDRSVTP